MTFKIGDKVLVANLDIESAIIVEEKVCSFTQKSVWWVQIKLLGRELPFYGAFFKDTLTNIGDRKFWLESAN